MRYLSLLFALYCSSSLAGPTLDATEQEIVAQVNANQPQALALLERAVNINSGTMNFVGVRAVGQLFSTELAALGFSTDWIDGEAFQRAGHLVAQRGDTGPKLLLIGHLDTVFAKNSPLQQFIQLDPDSASGPGITDMKGGDVVMVQALKALRSVGVLDQLQIRVVMTGDEERRGRPLALANKALMDAARWADYAIGFEDGDGNPETAVTSRRGSSAWRLEVSGKAAHSSQIFREDIGYGAIFEAARILDEFRSALAAEPNLTFNPGVIVGGTEIDLDEHSARGSAYGKNNVIAKAVTVSGGIRAISPAQLAMAQARMQEIVAANLAQTSASLEFLPGYPPMAATQGNAQLLQMYDQISQQLGYGAVRAVDPRRAGAADISFAANEVKGAIDGLGLMGSGGHTLNEVADLRTLAQQTQRAALLMYRLR